MQVCDVPVPSCDSLLEGSHCPLRLLCARRHPGSRAAAELQPGMGSKRQTKWLILSSDCVVFISFCPEQRPPLSRRSTYFGSILYLQRFLPSLNTSTAKPGFQHPDHYGWLACTALWEWQPPPPPPPKTPSPSPKQKQIMRFCDSIAPRRANVANSGLLEALLRFLPMCWPFPAIIVGAGKCLHEPCNKPLLYPNAFWF